MIFLEEVEVEERYESHAAHEYAIWLIESYIDAVYEDAIFPDDIKVATYASWAGEELIELIQKEPDIPPLKIVGDFRDKMEKYSVLNPRTSLIFQTACDTANDIIDFMS